MVVEITEALIDRLAADATLVGLLGKDEEEAADTSFYDIDPEGGIELDATHLAYLVVGEEDEGFAEGIESFPELAAEIGIPDQEYLILIVAKTRKLALQIRDRLLYLLPERYFETTNYAVKRVVYAGSANVIPEEKGDGRHRREVRVLLTGQYRKTPIDVNDWPEEE